LKQRTVVIGGGKVTILCSIKGLVKEKGEVKKAISELRPDLVGLAISPEELKAMDRVRKKGKDVDKKECVLSNYEEVYAKKLSKFGTVKAPPRAISAAFKLCREKNIPLEAIDLNNKDYADVYADAVTTSQLIAHTFKWRQLKLKRFKAETPEEFVLQWDRQVTKLSGFRMLEEARERYMAKMLQRLVKRMGHRHVVAIIELERVKGVCSRLGGCEEK